jgi:transposase
VKLGKSAAETPEMLCEAFGEHSLSRTVVSEWHSRFKVGRVSLEDEVRGDQTPAKRQKMLKKIRELINEDRRRTIHEVADTVGISYGVC